jgi:hypothetical protein
MNTGWAATMPLPADEALQAWHPELSCFRASRPTPRIDKHQSELATLIF